MTVGKDLKYLRTYSKYLREHQTIDQPSDAGTVSIEEQTDRLGKNTPL